MELVARENRKKATGSARPLGTENLRWERLGKEKDHERRVEYHEAKTGGASVKMRPGNTAFVTSTYGSFGLARNLRQSHASYSPFPKNRGNHARVVKIGREGLSPALLKALDDTLTHHGLVKVKFDEFKEQKKELAPILAEKVQAQTIMRVGNVVVLFRRRRPPEAKEDQAPGA